MTSELDNNIIENQQQQQQQQQQQGNQGSDQENGRNYTDLEIGFMDMAVQEGTNALDNGEVPVGVIIVKCGQVIGRGSNRTNIDRNGTRHAEFVAIEDVEKSFPEQFPDIISGADVYVTCEPCIMCAAALSYMQIKRVYFGCHNDRFGGNGSILDLSNNTDLPESYHRYSWNAGLQKDKAINLFRLFYSRDNIRAPETKKRKRKQRGDKLLDDI